MKKVIEKTTGLLLFSVLIFCSACTAEESTDQASVGTQAGVAVREMQKTAQETYDETSIKTKEALEEFDAMARKNMEEFSEQAAVALTQFQKTAEEMMKRLNTEMQKFNEALKESNEASAKNSATP